MVHNTTVPAPSTIQRCVADFRKDSYEGKLNMLRFLLGVKYVDRSWLLLLRSLYRTLVEDEVPDEFNNHYRHFMITGEIKMFQGLNGAAIARNHSSISNAVVQENNAAEVEDHIFNELDIGDSDSDCPSGDYAGDYYSSSSCDI